MTFFIFCIEYLYRIYIIRLRFISIRTYNNGWKIENFSAFAREIHGNKCYENRFFDLLYNAFQTNANILQERYPLSELRRACATSCEKIHNVLKDNGPKTPEELPEDGPKVPENLTENGQESSKGPKELTEYVEYIRTLDYSDLLEFIKHFRIEYFNTTPRDATEDEIMAHYKSLSSEEQKAKVEEVRAKIEIGKTIQEELTKLYKNVQEMKEKFPNA